MKENINKGFRHKLNLRKLFSNKKHHSHFPFAFFSKVCTNWEHLYIFFWIALFFLDECFLNTNKLLLCVKKQMLEVF